MDLKEAMQYPFKDPEWLRKAIVGSIIALLAFPLFFLGIPVLFGWGMAIARDVRDGAPAILPSWSRLTSYYLDGLKPFVATILWLTPSFLLLFISAALPSGSAPTESAILASTLLFVLALGLMFIAGFASPFQFGVAAETGSFVSAADPVSVFRFVRSCPGSVLAAWLVCVGSYYVLYTIGVLLCVVGCLPALVYQYALWGHAFGQVLRSRKTPTTR